eukprot:19144-Heterococcus_DN1.PRE.2
MIANCSALARCVSCAGLALISGRLVCAHVVGIFISARSSNAAASERRSNCNCAQITAAAQCKHVSRVDLLQISTCDATHPHSPSQSNLPGPFGVTFGEAQHQRHLSFTFFSCFILASASGIARLIARLGVQNPEKDLYCRQSFTLHWATESQTSTPR